MSSGCDSADILGLSKATWKAQTLHAPDRIWPETNCYVDVWAELLPALGHPAEAALAFTVRQDFEGDHFTFFKFPLEDLEALFGLAVQELAIYDSVESHTLAQLQRGRPVLIEVDSHWLPDAGPAYRKQHVKTTVAAIALDRIGKRLGYFHNTGYHELSGQDYDGLFCRPTGDRLFPYVEFVKRDGAALDGPALRQRSLELLRAHLRRRPKGNPIAAWRGALPKHLETLAGRDMGYFHLYAFNLPRQLGANFEMLATYLDWLAEPALAEPAAAARRIAEGAKAIQFQLARMANRRRFDAAKLVLEPIEADYDRIMTAVARFA
ncbi:MAG: DUF1839 family protein [Proteobacteria bacterium]|nr:DUF1839 family protein [Pseudomonadota bacterium]